MGPEIQALIMLAILAASAIVFTVVFVLVADRELAKPMAGETNETREGNEDNNVRNDREENSGGEESDGRIGREEEDDESGGRRGA